MLVLTAGLRHGCASPQTTDFESLVIFLGPSHEGYESQQEAFKKHTDGLVYGIMLLGLSVYLYAALTYPLISPHVGGGKPLLVSLALKPEHRHTLGQIMGREDWKCVMHNISLIHENPELVYVLPHGYLANDSAIAIPKSELISIAYQKKEKIEHSTCLESLGEETRRTRTGC